MLPTQSRSMIFVFFVVFISACSSGKSTAPREAWNLVNDPLHFSSSYERQLEKLPESGQLAERPWSDTYWPSNKGGIASRWQESSQDGFSYKTYSQDALQTMSESEIAELSPAEKYDILQDRFDYPTVTKERGRTSPQMASWEGICHGWAPAAFLYSEPVPVTLTSPSGIRVPLGSSDIKALLTYYHAVVSPSHTAFLGNRCDVDLNSYPDAASRPECKDTNAGAFHIVLTNQIGLWKKSFLMDITRGVEVWNQPVYAYRLSIDPTPRSPSIGAAVGTDHEIIVHAEVSYTTETYPNWKAHSGNLAQQVYDYRLELNAQGVIIGGEWISNNRPDFLWQQERPSYTGYYGNIEKIYQASTLDVAPVPTPTAQPTVEPTPVTLPTAEPTPVTLPTAEPTPVTSPAPEPTPTALPTEEPTPVASPTADPTPTTLPTAEPTPVTLPTAEPTPIVVPTAEPLPIVTPVHPNQPHRPAHPGRGNSNESFSNDGDIYFCPTGYRAVQVSDSTTPMWTCFDASSGNAVRGPFPSSMVRSCQNLGYGETCRSLSWSSHLYFQLRGNELCPFGSRENNQHLCVDGTSFYGPFPLSFVKRCRSLGYGEKCESLEWNASLIRAVQ